jgi:hypothetical protein
MKDDASSDLAENPSAAQRACFDRDHLAWWARLLRPHRFSLPAWAAALAGGALILFASAGCKPGLVTSAKINVTQAYQTVSAHLTQDLATLALQTSPPSLTPQPTQPTATPQALLPSPTFEPPRAMPTLTATLVCDRAAAGNPFDISIPDDTTLQPGTTFTKIWRLQNLGSCTWTTSYAVRFFYGAQMDAPVAVPLRSEVVPGQSVDIAVDMVAPQTPGSQQGNWKLSNASGQLFGIGPNGDAPFWVRINVLEPPTATPTPPNTVTPAPTSTATPTLTPTPTPTALVQSDGLLVLMPTTNVDLDTGAINPGSGSDLQYEMDAANLHLLLPQGSATLGVSGSSEPGLAQCQAATKSAASLALESLPSDTYLCYQTDQGLSGWLFYRSLNTADGSANLLYRTWAATP